MTKWLMFIASVPACSASAVPQVRAKVVGAPRESGREQMPGRATQRCPPRVWAAVPGVGRRGGVFHGE